MVLREDLERLLPTADERAAWSALAGSMLLPRRGAPGPVRAALAHVPAVTLTEATGVEALVARGVVDEGWLEPGARTRSASTHPGTDASVRDWLVTLACDAPGIRTAERLCEEFEARQAACFGRAPPRWVPAWKVLAHDAPYVTALRSPVAASLVNAPYTALAAAWPAAQNRAIGPLTQHLSAALATPATELDDAEVRVLRAARWRRRGALPTVLRNELLALLRDQFCLHRAAALGLSVGAPRPSREPLEALAEGTRFDALPDVYEPLVGVWSLGYLPARIDGRLVLLAAQR